MAKPKQPASRRPKASPGAAAKPGAGTAKAPGARGGAVETRVTSPGAGMPSAGITQAGAAQALAPPPQSVRYAVTLMYAGAALSAANLIITLATLGQAKSALHAARPQLSPAVLSMDMRSYVGSSIVVWLLTIALWLVMARTNLAGRGWARITATVLAVASTLSFLAYLGQPASVLNKVILLPLWLAGVGAIVLLWRRESTAYIRAETALARARQS